jgi:hypothetical protein
MLEIADFSALQVKIAQKLCAGDLHTPPRLQIHNFVMETPLFACPLAGFNMTVTFVS